MVLSAVVAVAAIVVAIPTGVIGGPPPASASADWASAASASAASASADWADDSGRPGPLWAQPVDAPVVDPFRAPSHRYGPGNRGIEYGTVRGQVVKAVDDGVVTFAGAVGTGRHVVIDHGRGPGGARLRSTYAYLSGIEVAVGDRVGRGDRVGTAAIGFHLTARLNDVYVDPALFLGSVRFRVRLVTIGSVPATGR